MDFGCFCLEQLYSLELLFIVNKGYNIFLFCIIEGEGLNPVWKEPFRCTVNNPELAIIKFVVQYEDMFLDPKFLAQAAYPVTCLRPGKYFNSLISYFFLYIYYIIITI